jgi:hypothetical protein
VSALPILFSNTIPAWGVIVLTIGWIERDGFVLLLGYLYVVAVGIAGVTVATLVGRHGINWIFERSGLLQDLVVSYM